MGIVWKPRGYLKADKMLGPSVSIERLRPGIGLFRALRFGPERLAFAGRTLCCQEDF